MAPSESVEQPQATCPVNARIEWLIIDDSSDPVNAAHLSASGFRYSNEFCLDERILSLSDRHPVFANILIDKPLTFAGKDKIFRCGVSFVNVVFECLVDFNAVLFQGPAYFWGCTFRAGMNLTNIRVRKNLCEIHRREPGEANFSYCHFNKRLLCDRAVFEGRGYLHRTIFCEGASFTGSKFNEPFNFESSSSDICIPKSDIKSRVTQATDASTYEAISAYMDKTDVTHVCIDWEHYVNFDPYIISTKGLKNRLKRFECGDSGKAQRAIEAVCETWNIRYLHTMFSDPFVDVDRSTQGIEVSSHTFDKVYDVDRENKIFLTDFRGCEFCKATTFRNVDLGYCLFSGSNVSEIDFVVSYWAKQRCNPMLHKWLSLGGKWNPLFSTQRQALRDELELERRREREGFPEEELAERRLELGELYRELRIAYVRDGDTLIGRDFFFGETEMSRLSKTLLRRIFSLSFLYKVLAGYSRQEGLAILWLSVLLLVLPVGYVGVNAAEQNIMHRAVMQSDAARLTGSAPRDSNTCELDPEDQTIIAAAQQVVGDSTPTRAFAEGMRQSLEAAGFLTAKTRPDLIAQAGKTLDENCIGTGEFMELPLGLEFSLVGWESVRHLLASTEKFLVIAQIALVFICLRSRFQRIT